MKKTPFAERGERGDTESDVNPVMLPSIAKILAVIACLIAVAITGGASIHFAINEARFPVGTVIQLLASLFCLWASANYKIPVDSGKVPDMQAGNAAQEFLESGPTR